VRTTLTLEADVAALLTRARITSRTSFKLPMNEALRRGLKAVNTWGAKRKKVCTRTCNAGKVLGPKACVPLPIDGYREFPISLRLSNTNKIHLAADPNLAALAIEQGLFLCSAEGDLARFKHLRWQNPLE
jgi:hypothetical protein